MVELGILLFIFKRNIRVFFIQDEKIKEKLIVYNEEEFEFATLFFWEKIEIIQESGAKKTMSECKDEFARI
jgi:hypothetical protein